MAPTTFRNENPLNIRTLVRELILITTFAAATLCYYLPTTTPSEPCHRHQTSWNPLSLSTSMLALLAARLYLEFAPLYLGVATTLLDRPEPPANYRDFVRRLDQNRGAVVVSEWFCWRSAAPVEAQVKEEEEDEEACCICWTAEFRQHGLPCGHFLCIACLTRIGSMDTTVVLCPHCRRVLFPLPEEEPGLLAKISRCRRRRDLCFLILVLLVLTWGAWHFGLGMCVFMSTSMRRVWGV